ncbi:TetR family transcriptional regulator [Streptomonospora alba]|uniref:TetR family transcriptional regulator n=1 Tax=Streptomonospora alba TaxID=183763 RepID=A0A0C2JAF8_9ACTN|nr:TetR/AcrR family transcriptional regulator [Streptomonospora alba]KIH98451.1 TetR family transcriptional regulator [Streptomonospora alba]
MSEGTRTRLLAAALRILAVEGIAGASVPSIAAAAGVDQALVLSRFDSVEDLLAEACRYGARRRVARYRDRFAAVASVDELVELGRSVHAEERAAGHVALLAQLLAAAQGHPRLGEATAAGLELWAAEIEQVLHRVLDTGPLGGLVDVGGLARAMAAGFVGVELYGGADADGAERALRSLEQLGQAAAVVEELGPLAQRALRARLRRSLPPARPAGVWGEWE